MDYGQKILIIDDEVLLTYSVSKYLAKKGFNVKASSCPDQALSILESESFDVVITDLRMAPVTGIDIIRHLRRSGYVGKIIVMSAYFKEFEEDLQALKVDAFVEKPFELSRLLNVIAPGTMGPD